jgi:hypothetical protein
MKLPNAFAVSLVTTLLAAVSCMAAAPPDFEDIGISRDELVSFLQLIKTASATRDIPRLCRALAYPIHVTNLYGSATYLSEKECAQKFSTVFSSRLLNTIGTVSESELSEIKTMVMVRGGQFWISKFWVSKQPQQSSPELNDFHDTRLWQMRIVDINQ